MNCKKTILPVLLGLLAVACSTTRVLPEGKYRLAGNRIKVGGREVRSSELTSYLTQKPNSSVFGYSPSVAIYNWADTADTWWNNFIRKFGAPPVIYDAAQVNASSDNMDNHLTYLGFYGSDIRDTVEFKGKRAYVTYYIHPGKRYRIRSIDYELPEDEEFRREFETDRRQTTLQEGQYLSEASLEEESVRSSQFFRNRGYFGFDKSYYFFEADTLSGDGTAALTMAIRNYPRNGSPDDARPHRKFTIGNVTLSTPENVPVRSGLLEDMNVLRPGRPYSERAVDATYSRLASLSVFNSVNVTMNPVSDDVVDCDIVLQNGGVQGVKANLETSVNSTGLYGISPQLNYFHKNFFHGGILLNMGLKGNFQFKFSDPVRSTEFSVTSSLRFPQFIGLPNSLFRGPNLPHTDISLGFSYQDRPEYKRTMITTSFGYTGNLGRNFFYQLYPFQANIVRLFSMTDSFQERLVEDMFLINAYSDHFDMGVGGMLYYTTDASSIPKRSYRYARLNLDLSGNLLSLFNRAMPTDDWTGQHTIWAVPYAQYIRGELQLGQTFRFGSTDKQAVALRFLIGAGYGYGNSSTVPFEKQFFAGGAGSMRGWQARDLGPGSVEPWSEYFLIPSQTGDFKMEANVEYRFPLFWKLEGAAFVDAGNVWELREDTFWEGASNFSPDSIAGDWGLGIRVNLDFILVRIDLGNKVYEPCRPAGSRWIAPKDWLSRGNYAIHFGVGYPF